MSAIARSFRVYAEGSLMNSLIPATLVNALFDNYPGRDIISLSQLQLLALGGEALWTRALLKIGLLEPVL